MSDEAVLLPLLREALAGDAGATGAGCCDWYGAGARCCWRQPWFDGVIDGLDLTPAMLACAG